jgi:hypothetical protein
MDTPEFFIETNYWDDAVSSAPVEGCSLLNEEVEGLRKSTIAKLRKKARLISVPHSPSSNSAN